MKKILIINAHYYPGYRSGGPQQSMMNLVDVLGDKFNFYILTHNYDFGQKESYKNVEFNKWVDVGKAKVYYYSEKKYSYLFLKRFIKDFDIIYLCEPYQQHSYKVLLLNKLKYIKDNIILAPMGCFSKAALSQKKIKKYIFWRIFKFLRLYNGITWSFSSINEFEAGISEIGRKCIQKYYIAEDLPRKFVDFTLTKSTTKSKGNINIIFLSRICEMKNLSFAIKVISKLKGDIYFDIYGIIEDENYWQLCIDELEKLPQNIKYKYYGEVEPDYIISTFLKYDIFCFPTKGENFGHVIYESMVSGCIPVISDNTSWSSIETENCGKVISLDNEELFITHLQRFTDMSYDEIRKFQNNAMIYASKKYYENINKSGYYNLFE